MLIPTRLRLLSQLCLAVTVLGAYEADKVLLRFAEVDTAHGTRDRALASECPDVCGALGENAPRVVLVTFDFEALGSATRVVTVSGCSLLHFMPETSFVVHAPTAAAACALSAAPGVTCVQAVPHTAKSPLPREDGRRALAALQDGSARGGEGSDFALAYLAVHVAGTHVPVASALRRVIADGDLNLGACTCPRNDGGASDGPWVVAEDGATVGCVVHMVPIPFSGMALGLHEGQGCAPARRDVGFHAMSSWLVRQPSVVWVDLSMPSRSTNAYPRGASQSVDPVNWQESITEYGTCEAPAGECYVSYEDEVTGQARSRSSGRSLRASAGISTRRQRQPGSRATADRAGLLNTTCAPECAVPSCDFGFQPCDQVSGASPISLAGLTGSGQLVTVLDSGLDVSNPFFYDGKVQLVTTRNYTTSLSSHRKVPMYYAFMDGSDAVGGHGTHCAGSVAGSLDLTATTPGDAAQLTQFNGMAPGARVIFTDLTCNDPEGCMCPPQLADRCVGCGGRGMAPCPPSTALMTTPYPFDVQTPGYLNGARISSNSYGVSIQPFYSAMEQGLDQMIRDHDDFLVLFAASNDGFDSALDSSTRYASLGDGGVAKNVLAVGATQTDLLTQLFEKVVYLSESDMRSCSGTIESLGGGSACEESCGLLASLAQPDGYGVYDFSLALCCGCTLQDISTEEPDSILNLLYAYESRWRAPYSSVGPTLDGRIKPDVMAVGSRVMSARGTGGRATKSSGYNVWACADGASTLVNSSGVRPISFPGEGTTDDLSFVWTSTVVFNAKEPLHVTRMRLPLQSALTSATTIGAAFDSYDVGGNGMRLTNIILVASNASVKARGYVDFPLALNVPAGASLYVYLYAPVGQSLGLYVNVAQPNVTVCWGDASAGLSLTLTTRRGQALSTYATPQDGTSMATPVAAGNAVLVRQYFTDGFLPTGRATPGNGFHPSAALLKAVLINGASTMLMADPTFAGPLSFGQVAAETGFGAINLVRSLSFASLGTASRTDGSLPTLLLPGLTTQIYAAGSAVPEPTTTTLRGVDPTLTHGATAQYCVDVTQVPGGARGFGLPLSITLVWTDPAGSPLALYPLVNDLDLEVITPAGAAPSRLLRGNNDVTLAVQVRDDRNNVEKLVLPLPPYTVASDGSRRSQPYGVIVRGSSVPLGPQNYSLVITGPLISLAPAGSCGPVPAPNALTPGADPKDVQVAALTAAVDSKTQSLLATSSGLGTTVAVLAVGLLILTLRSCGCCAAESATNQVVTAANPYVLDWAVESKKAAHPSATPHTDATSSSTEARPSVYCSL